MGKAPFTLFLLFIILLLTLARPAPIDAGIGSLPPQSASTLHQFEWRPATMPQSLADEPTANWMLEVVVSERSFDLAPDHSLRLDSQGYPHIAYGGNRLYYAWFDGIEWHREIADGAGGVGAFASLDLDARGFPHIGYHDFANGDLKYAYKDTEGWHAETVRDGNMVGYRTSLAVDKDGRPHIACTDFEGDYVLHVYRDENGWHGEVVEWGWIGGISMAIDDIGHPHIAFTEHTSEQVRVAHHDGTVWRTETVVTGEDIHGEVSLALDSHNRAHLLFTDSAYLRYAYPEGDVWGQTVVKGVSGSAGPSLVIDDLNYPVGCKNYNLEIHTH